HVDEIARAGLGGEFEMLAPAHAGAAAHDVDHALERAVVMSAGLGVRMDGDGAGPDLLGADARGVDRRLAVHAGRLCRVRIERVARDDSHAVVLPFRLVRMIVVVAVIVAAHGSVPFTARAWRRWR